MDITSDHIIIYDNDNNTNEQDKDNNEDDFFEYLKKNHLKNITNSRYIKILNNLKEEIEWR